MFASWYNWLKGPILRRLDSIDKRLESLHKKIGDVMAQFDDVQALVEAINTETNGSAAAIQAVSDRIDKLIAGIPSGGLTADQTEQLKVQLAALRDAQTPIKDRLILLGQDASNPIPEPIE